MTDTDTGETSGIAPDRKRRGRLGRIIDWAIALVALDPNLMVVDDLAERRKRQRRR